jgi:tetratricopeptide (TPR) repeat protein
MPDFFISYTSADQAWANWIAWQLRSAGRTTVHQAWDFRPGANFVSEMKRALEGSARTLAVLSPNYFNSGFAEDEWTAAFADRSLLPVLVRDCALPKLLRTVVYIDLRNLAEAAAREALLSGAGARPAAPSEPPPFPVKEPPLRYPGALPAIWEVRLRRNPNFTGRDPLLGQLHAALRHGGAAALTQAIHGLGGVGKTQLALEYAYRYSSDYDLVGWLRAEEPSSLASDYARLAAPLHLPEKDVADQPAIVAAVRNWLARHDRWLLIFDNAPDPQSCAEYQPPSDTGHILITSRNRTWAGVAGTLPVLQWSRPESLEFLKKRTRRDEPDAANRLAEAVGDLPLALEIAAAYIDEASLSLAAYVDLLGRYAKELLAPVAATWRISIDKLKTENPAAIGLLNVLAYLAPDDIPRDILADDSLSFNEAVKSLSRYSLIGATPDSLSVHRLVQRTLRESLEAAGDLHPAEAALDRIAGAFPDPLDHRNWPNCSRLLPHATEVANHGERLDARLEDVSALLNQAGLYEMGRAQLRSAASLMARALAIDEKVYGPDHPNVAIRANNLGQILKAQGDLEGALRYTQRALAIDEKVYGPDHPTVAILANNLGQILKAQGDLEGARTQLLRALSILQSTYGPDHPLTKTVARNLERLE